MTADIDQSRIEHNSSITSFTKNGGGKAKANNHTPAASIRNLKFSNNNQNQNSVTVHSEMNIIDGALPTRNSSTHKKDTIITQAGFDQVVAIRGRETRGADTIGGGGHSGQSTLRMSHVLQSHNSSQSRAQSGQKRQILKIL